MIELREVSKSYRGRNFEVRALSSVSLNVPPGQYLSVVGKSGSGKSTLMKIIGLLDFDFAGEHRFQGREFRGAPDDQVSRARRRIGYVFQDFQLVGRHTVRRNLEMASVIRTGSFRTEEIETALDEVGLPDKAESFPDELSGGQKQRVAIARAVLGRPDLVVADEPTGALDVATATGILALLRGIQQTHGCGVLLVTHDPEIAAGADRTIELVNGEVARDVLR